MSNIFDMEHAKGGIGPLKDKAVVDISANDFVDSRGFLVVAATTGDLTYRTLAGSVDQTETGLAIGDLVNVGGFPVVCRAVRTASTVTSIVVGYL